MKRGRIQPKASWKRLRRRTQLKPLGKKGKEWKDAPDGLKLEFEAIGITSCELKYEDCWTDNALGFAHAAKRRKLSREDLKHVILICNPCHDRIEFLPPEEMKRIVDVVCQQRELMLINRQ
jgi:hypothetical protein